MLPQRFQPCPLLPDFGRPQPGNDGREGQVPLRSETLGARRADSLTPRPLHQFRSQARLADARFAQYEDQRSFPFLHRTPRFLQTTPFLLPSDQPHLLRCFFLPKLRLCVLLRTDQPLVKRLNFLRRLDAEFAPYSGRASVIDLQSARAVVHQRAQTHGLEIGALIQRVGADETVRGFDSFLVAAHLFESLRQLRQRI